MYKILFSLAIGTFALMSCSKDILPNDSGNGNKPHGKNKVTIEITEGGTITRSDRTEHNGGYTTGAGAYDGRAYATVTAHANPGYQLSYLEKSVDSGNNLYNFELLKIDNDKKNIEHRFYIQGQDWLFKVKFAKEFTINATGENGTVTGGGTYAEGDKCTLTAKANDEYQFDGWYENGTKISSENPYSFFVSSSQNITAKFAKKTLDITISSEQGSWSKIYNETSADIDIRNGAGDKVFVKLSIAKPIDQDIKLHYSLAYYTPDWLYNSPLKVEYGEPDHYSGTTIIKRGETSVTLQFSRMFEYYETRLDDEGVYEERYLERGFYDSGELEVHPENDVRINLLWE